MRAKSKASCFVTDGTGPVRLSLVSRMLPTRSELAGTALRSPLSCLKEYCRSSVSHCLQLCVSTCIQYVSACVLPASCATAPWYRREPFSRHAECTPAWIHFKASPRTHPQRCTSTRAAWMRPRKKDVLQIRTCPRAALRCNC